jgi:hypothetical protein
VDWLLKTIRRAKVDGAVCKALFSSLARFSCSALIGSGPGARPNPPPVRQEPTPEPKPAPVSAPVNDKPAAKKEKPLSEEEKKEQLEKKTDSFLKEYLSA